MNDGGFAPAKDMSGSGCSLGRCAVQASVFRRYYRLQTPLGGSIKIIWGATALNLWISNSFDFALDFFDITERFKSWPNEWKRDRRRHGRDFQDEAVTHRLLEDAGFKAGLRLLREKNVCQILSSLIINISRTKT